MFRRNLVATAVLLALAAPAHAEETLGQARSNFDIACGERTGAPATLPETCGIALQYGYDLTLSMLAVCVKTGARGDAVVQCVKGQAATLGLQ
jgi:hypothetical protein